jgi:AraC-like DNA-binding protein
VIADLEQIRHVFASTISICFLLCCRVMFEATSHEDAAGPASDVASYSGGELFKPHVQLVQGPLASYLKALIAVEVAPLPATTLPVIPHDHYILSVHLGPRTDHFECNDAPGMSVKLTALRDVRGNTYPPGNCVTLFAILTPEGALRLLHGYRLQERERIRAPLAAALGLNAVRRLEDALRMYMSVQDKLACFGRWLEQGITANHVLSVQAQRAARAASTLMHAPYLPVQDLAAQEHVSARQLERDFHTWLLVSPKQFAQVVRVQHAARLRQRNLSLAHIAAEARFADQAHMSRAMKALSGLPPRRLLHTAPHPMARAFSAALRGGIVYV